VPASCRSPRSIVSWAHRPTASAFLVAPLLSLALSLSFIVRTDTTGAAKDVVRQALLAVEGDSIVPVRARWTGRLRHDAGDRAALLGIATLARLTYDYLASERFYSQLFSADSLHPDSYAAYARLGRAWSLEERGLSDAAGDEFARARRVARVAGAPAAEAEALIGLAFPRGVTQGVTVALALLDSAGPLIPPWALDLRAERGWRRAMVHGILADPRATAEAEASVELARRAGGLRVQAQAFRGLARVLDWRGQEDSALAAFREAEQRFRLARDRTWLAVTLNNRANTLRKRGDLGETMETLRLALIEGEASHNLWAVASAHTNLGVIALQLNDFTTAAEHLNRAVTMFEAQGDRSSAMNARKFLPLIALAGRDFTAARRQTLEALAFYRGTGETLDQFAAYQMLATLAMRERDWTAADSALAQARALLPKLEGPHWGAELSYEQGRLALARGELSTAERSFTRFLSALDSAQHLSRYDARLRLADIDARRLDLGAAEREATAAWDELDRWRATLTDRELRLLAFQLVPSELQVSPANLSEQRAGVARVLAALAAGGRAPHAFELAERRRARELMDRMARAQALRTRSPEESRQLTVPHQAEALSAAGLAALIPDRRTAILEYVTGGLGAPTTLFVLTRPGPDGVAVRARVLPPADSLAGELTRFLALVQRGDDAGLARAFGRALLDPAQGELDTAVTRLIVVPDGPLHRVPWDLLRLSDGRYVVQRYAVSVAPSAAILAALWRHPRAGTAAPDHPAPLLAFGDPTFAREAQVGPAIAQAQTYGVLDSAEGLPRLAASGREARLVSRYSPEAAVRLRSAASARFLKQTSLERFRVIHFATHAVVDERSAARTVLALAPDGGDNGLVGPGDLAALRLDADLVVLSACRTAGGVLVEGEGVQGLTAPLIQAGARSVVASQWRIADNSTVTFIQAFYEALARGLPVGDALRAAKLDALRRGAPPREWAAFTIVGDPLVRVPLRVPRPDRWPSAVLVATLALGAAGIAYSRSRR
jgi:CHAT domain-containing protein/tetratricopeptide (TPR) repeat protein